MPPCRRPLAPSPTSRWPRSRIGCAPTSTVCRSRSRCSSRHWCGTLATASSATRTSPAWPAGRRPRPAASSPATRRASCCRTSPASRRWSTSPRCARPWPAWAATRSASTRSCPPTWSSTTRSRSTSSPTSTPSRSTCEREYERNGERYALLRWTQEAFKNFRVVPPGRGIVHQVNLEYLASVVYTERTASGQPIAYPDSLVGTDSHTTMVNGLGVLGWGVGGIEAEAVLLGQPLYLLTPEVVGFRFVGQLPEGATATDLVLTVTELLRKKGVVGRFVEFTGPGLSQLGLADRATISNMCPEYGATAALFPVDDETLRYLRMTGRDPAQIDLVERYCKDAGPFPHRRPAPSRASATSSSWTCPRSSRAWPGRAARRTGSAWRDVGASIRAAYPAQFPDANRPQRAPPPSKSRSAASQARLPMARLPSPPSRAAPTPPTRWSCSAPGCSPARRSRRGCPCQPRSRRAWRPARAWSPTTCSGPD